MQAEIWYFYIYISRSMFFDKAESRFIHETSNLPLVKHFFLSKRYIINKIFDRRVNNIYELLSLLCMIYQLSLLKLYFYVNILCKYRNNSTSLSLDTVSQFYILLNSLPRALWWKTAISILVFSTAVEQRESPKASKKKI